MTHIRILTAILAAILCTSVKAQAEFPYPHIPDSITANHERLGWMLCNFWKNYNFADYSTENLDVAEQGFVDFIELIQSADSAQTAQASAIFAEQITPHYANTGQHFADLTDHYLANPESPMHDDRIYVAVVGAILDKADTILPTAVRIKMQARRELAALNLPGHRANDFEYADSQNRTCTLYNTDAELTILYFYDPECERCAAVQKEIEELAVLQVDRVRVLHIYPESDTVAISNADTARLHNNWTEGHVCQHSLTEQGLYWFAKLPSLYLLDSHKTVILKDATPAALATQMEMLLSK